MRTESDRTKMSRGGKRLQFVVSISDIQRNKTTKSLSDAIVIEYDDNTKFGQVP